MAAVRALVFAVTSTGLAVTGHHLASGGEVSWPGVWTACALLFLLASPFARRPRSLCAVVSATGAAQAAVHLWLARAAPDTKTADALHTAAGHGSTHGGHEGWHSAHHGAAMTAAHIAAALLVAWSMQRADASCSALGESLGNALAGVFVRLGPARGVAPVPRILRPVGARAQAPSRNSQVLAHAVTRRGPPTEPASAI
ncbi:hypothetical protein ACFRKD_00680 [Streptomyces niveus]|uniref:hypothetical protein n=1 Tax=Streptomyces niveus TaxID=193462 RepID=UPI0036B285CF